MHNPTAPTDVDRRANAIASPAGPGPARRPPRSRSKPGRRADERGEPLSCSPLQSRCHARTPTSDARERNRPRSWSCGCRPLRQGTWPLFCQCAGCPTPPDTHCASSGGRSAASRLAVRRRLAGRPACVTVQGRRAGPKPGKSAYPARQSIQKRHRKRSEYISQAFRHHRLTIPKCLPQPSTGGKTSKAAAGLAAPICCSRQMPPRIAAVVRLHSCARASWRAQLVCRRGRVGRQPPPRVPGSGHQ